MPTEFNTLRGLYDSNQFANLVHDPDGIYWLKLRSVSRAPQLRDLCQRTGINYEGIPGRQLFAYVYNHRPDEQAIDHFISELYEEERSARRENENYLVSQLYQMRVFDWGGLYQNSLERTIINNYVKRIQSWDELNNAIENEIHASMQGYVQCSWYNHWTSIIIEDIFKDHPGVLPAVGLVKQVDFFIHNFPFDLKVTYFPAGYMRVLRRRERLRPEFTELKAFCRQEDIWFDRSRPERVLFPELLAKISEYPTQSARDFMESFEATRARFVQQTIENPTELKVWLYENQGVRRFDAANRFFLILIDMEHLEESWKLKRNKKLLADTINAHLDTMQPGQVEDLEISFNWQNNVYETYADALFITVQE
jgi:hypothetical protein